MSMSKKRFCEIPAAPTPCSLKWPGRVYVVMSSVFVVLGENEQKGVLIDPRRG